MRVLLTGASGQLGAYLVARLLECGHQVTALSGAATGERSGVPLVPADLTDAAATERLLRQADPEVVVHAAALSTAEAVRLDPERGRAINVAATGHLANWCAGRGRRLVYTSTDLVFDGRKAWNREDDPAEPVMAYGRTKREGELEVLRVPGGVVARVSLLYGPSQCGREAFFGKTVQALREGRPQTLFVDEYRTPIDLATAAELLVKLAESSFAGIVHVAGAERVSRYEMIARVAAALGLDGSLVRSNRQAEAVLPEPRPADISLDTTRLAGLWPDHERPNIEEALRRMGPGSPFAPRKDVFN